AMAVLFVPEADATRVYYGTDTHAFGLALGAALGFATANRPPFVESWSRGSRLGLQVAGSASLLGVLAIAALMRPEDPFTYRGGLVLVAALTTLTIAAAVQPDSWLGR